MALVDVGETDLVSLVVARDVGATRDLVHRARDALLHLRSTEDFRYFIFSGTNIPSLGLSTLDAKQTRT